jgi:hypothetical protein
MRRFVVRFGELEASNHTPSSAEFTTNTPELKFSVHTTAPAMDLIAEAFEKTTDSDGGPIVRPQPGQDHHRERLSSRRGSQDGRRGEQRSNM